MVKKILFCILSLVLFTLAFFYSKTPETNLAAAFISPSSNIFKLSTLSEKSLNVIFESKNQESIENAKSEFAEFNPQINEITDIYKDFPGNFLSDNTRKLIQTSNYKKLDESALAQIYNPLGLFIGALNKDPYQLSTDYLLEKMELLQEKDIVSNGNFYSVSHYKLKNNNDLEKFISLQNKFEDVNIYLTGSPIHAYVTTKKSIVEINLICTISILALILLSKFCFKTVKPIIPVSLSIFYGFLFGYSASTLVFEKLHVLTFVFSTSLVGIGLDYSLHYFLSKDPKNLKKNLTASMLTTVTAFSILAFLNIQILKQIALFTASGLFGVYLFVLVMLDKKFEIKREICPNIPENIQKWILGLVLIVVLAGFWRINFDDNIKSLYIPPKDLKNAESLYTKLFQPTPPEFLLVQGSNLNEILVKEEALDIPNSLSLKDFIQSELKQKENIELVKKLYRENLDEYGKFLSKEDIQNLKKQEFKIYNVEEFPLKDEFMLDSNTSYVIVKDHIEASISPVQEINKLLKQYRKRLFEFFPMVFGVLFLMLSFFFGFKNSLKIIAPSLFGILFSISLLSLAGVKLNLFYILAFMLVIGFGLDYSIFRLNSSKNSQSAVFISALSTAFSFLMLSFTSFKLISILGSALFLGVTSSYLLSLFMIKSRHE